MIKKIDKYIIKNYLATFLFVALMLSMIAVVIDFSDKVGDFLEEDITMYQVIVEYYLNFVFWINGLLWPLCALIAVIFFTSRLAFNSEIISILNAGVSFRRLMAPYLAAAGIIVGVLLLANHFVIPFGNKIRLDFEHTYIWKYSDKGKTNNVHLFTAPDTKVFIKFWRKKDTTARDFHIEKFKNNKITYFLKANKAVWLGPPNKWRLHNYEIRTFDGDKETIINGMGKDLDTTFNLTPEDFVRYNNQREMMVTPDLVKFIEGERARGVGNTKFFEVELHRRTADPFSIFILTIIGVSLAARKVRGGMGLHIAMGIGLGAMYIFVSKFATTFATNESLPVMLGAWIPNIVFTILAIFLVSKAQK